MHAQSPKPPLSQRFRGFLPVIVDIETGGFNPARNAMLEIAAVILDMDPADLPDSLFTTQSLEKVR